MALVSDDDVVRYTAVAVLNCGQVVVVPDGRVGVVQSMAPVAIGDTATVKVKGIMSITTAAALTAGDVVGVHIANQTLLAAGAAGTTIAGTLLYTAADASTAQVDLNVFPGKLTQGVRIILATASAGVQATANGWTVKARGTSQHKMWSQTKNELEQISPSESQRYAENKTKQFVRRADTPEYQFKKRTVIRKK